MFVAVLALDAGLKVAAGEFITEPVCGAAWLCLAVMYNDGLFGGFAPIVSGTLVSNLYWLVLPPTTLWLTWRVFRHNDMPVNLCIAAIGGGVVGNVWDLAMDGAITDFLGFPAYGEIWMFTNLADTAMVAGLGLLTVVLALRWRRKKARVREVDTHGWHHVSRAHPDDVPCRRLDHRAQPVRR